MDKKKGKTNIQTDPNNGSHDFLESLRGMIQAEVQRAIQDLKPSEVSGGKYPMAPQPKLKGKKFLNSERVKLSVMVDKNLYKQVLTAGRETSRSYSQIVDAALWHYFGKPKLSFEGKNEDGTHQGLEVTGRPGDSSRIEKSKGPGEKIQKRRRGKKIWGD